MPPVDRLRPGSPGLERGGNVENDDLVDALAVVARGERRRIPGLAQPLEADPFDDPAVPTSRQAMMRLESIIQRCAKCGVRSAEFVRRAECEVSEVRSPKCGVRSAERLALRISDLRTPHAGRT